MLRRVFGRALFWLWAAGLSACANPQPAPASRAPVNRASATSEAAPPSSTVSLAPDASSASTASSSGATTDAGTEPADAGTEPTAEARYTTPLLDAESLAELAKAACERARSEKRLVLLEFSAPWCKDCLLLEKLKTTEPLRTELERWEIFSINVGDGFQHPELMRSFRVDAIAKLFAVRPATCTLSLKHWPRGGARNLSGLAKQDRDASQELARWLSGQRQLLTRGAP